jgi:hypothetical protein
MFAGLIEGLKSALSPCGRVTMKARPSAPSLAAADRALDKLDPSNPTTTTDHPIKNRPQHFVSAPHKSLITTILDLRNAIPVLMSETLAVCAPRRRASAE